MENKTVPSTLLNMVLAMVIVATIASTVLSFSYIITKKAVDFSKNAKELEAIKEVVVDEFDNNPFEDKIILPNSNIVVYPIRQGSKIKSLAIKTQTQMGYNGKIELIVGFLLDGTINGYKVIDQKETPGLGTKITESKFSSQFVGINPGEVEFKVKQDGGDIDAITSATISSRAVVDAIQKAFDVYNKLNPNSTGEKDE